MRKIRIITVLMGIVTLFQGVPMTYAAPHVYTDGGRTDTKAFTDSSDSVEQNLNFSYFEIDATKSGKYFAEFWVLPAKYADGTYTNFSVYVNDEYVGQIVPDKDNWQSARIVGNKKISLRETRNTANGTNVMAMVSSMLPKPSNVLLDIKRLNLG
ncbi:MAG: hypothetical protein K2J58_03200 [Muribaculaceae bacterium]|nr:hypothetical protein [Muribaculaceae bacterium]